MSPMKHFLFRLNILPVNRSPSQIYSFTSFPRPTSYPLKGQNTLNFCGFVEEFPNCDRPWALSLALKTKSNLTRNSSHQYLLWLACFSFIDPFSVHFYIPKLWIKMPIGFHNSQLSYFQHSMQIVSHGKPWTFPLPWFGNNFEQGRNLWAKSLEKGSFLLILMMSLKSSRILN